MSKRDIPLPDKLSYYLLKSVNKAIRDYQMIADGDRVAVAVSGGKDSLTLLRLLELRLRSSLENYEIVAIHVAASAEGERSLADARSGVLERYLAAAGLEWAIEPANVDAPGDCFRCSYLRRKAILSTAWRLRCNKVALGHHADDAAQTTLLNLFFQGKVETLLPRRSFFDGKLTLVRPLIYVPEKEIVRFARAVGFPILESDCLTCGKSQRHRMRNLIRSIEKDYPKVRINLLRAGLPGAVQRANVDGHDADADSQNATAERDTLETMEGR